MKYLVATEKSVDKAVDDFKLAIARQKFGVLHIHDLHATLNSKGIDFEPRVQVLEVCNPQQAARVLAEDMDMNMALPCRVSVYEKDGKTWIAMLNPSEMLGMLSDSEALREVAEEVEAAIKAAIDEAA